MPSPSFVRRRLVATVTLAASTFDGSNNTLTLPAPGTEQLPVGFRISANIEKAGGVSMSTARIRIWGLTPAQMNACAQLAFHPLQVPNNQISLATGDGTMVYSGTILQAWPDYSRSPDVCLDLRAMTGYFDKLAPAVPSSYQGSADTSLAVQQLQQTTAQFPNFEDNFPLYGLTAPKVQNLYTPGTTVQQAQAVAQAANMDIYFDDHTIAICPKGCARRTAAVPVVSATTGLRGYPAVDRMGINFECLYNPAILFGGLVQLQSLVPQATGQWRCVSIAHDLESEVPDGAWFSNVWVTDNAVAIIPGAS